MNLLRNTSSLCAVATFAIAYIALSPAIAPAVPAHHFLPEELQRGCDSELEDNIHDFQVIYLPEEQQFYITITTKAVHVPGAAEGTKGHQNSFWLITSVGDTPKGHKNEYAMLYADIQPEAGINRITAYVYDTDESYKSQPYLGTYEDAFTIEEDGDFRTIKAILDTSVMNLSLDNEDWYGLAIGSEEVGAWFHTSFETTFEYGEIGTMPGRQREGYRDTGSAAVDGAAVGGATTAGGEETGLGGSGDGSIPGGAGEGGFGTADSGTGVTGGSETESVTGGGGGEVVVSGGGGGSVTVTPLTEGPLITVFERKSEAGHMDLEKEPALNITLSDATPSGIENELVPPVLEAPSTDGMEGSDDEATVGQAATQAAGDDAAEDKQLFSWCTLYDSLADEPSVGPFNIQAAAISGNNVGFTDENTLELDCLSSFGIHFVMSEYVDKIEIEVSGGEAIAMNRRETSTVQDGTNIVEFSISNTDAPDTQLFKYGQNEMKVTIYMFDGTIVEEERSLNIPRP